MVLIDTSVWLRMFKDKKGTEAKHIQIWLDVDDEREAVLTLFNKLELLQGCRDNKEWILLSSYLENQTYIEATNDTWQSAARIYYDLRCQGLTVRSPIDCCIASCAIENDLLLLHNDKDFNVIHQLRPLIHHQWQ